MMAWPNGTRYKTYSAGSSFPPADPNAIQDQILQVAGYRGVTSISATESRTNVAYGLLGTPDQVAGIVLPTDGLLKVYYQAVWQESVIGASRAAIFIGATQLKQAADGNAAPVVVETSARSKTAATDNFLYTTPVGLVTEDSVTAYTGDVTTGQVLGGFSSLSNSGGPVVVFAAAGTYTISVQFKSTSGSVTAKNRKLWVETAAFN